ncbi:GNAT family N-acetyltransferase [Streptomyces sp. Ru62]|uniref:GNAT family N-acetyltransferase n=1 Tax=Streptomyces sp. Ru62 TaxID=2080745 RepID=UPI000CDDA50A|nr:GNAT family N-acetyltransferase [Streptomyces sp. Ru62]POX64423.1 GNAT family N-acetyltransferase [Streptomyces sp. Ru62]
MTELTDIADLEPQLANCRDYWLGWGAQERQDGCLSLFRSGLADSQVNGVMRLRDADRAEEAVAEAVKRFDSLPFTWWVGPDSAPDVRRRLVDGGAREEGVMPIMAVRTDQVLHAAGPDALRVRPIGDSLEELSDWVRTYSPSFGLAPELHDDLVRIERGRTDAGRITRFAGRLDGQTVGTALLYVAHGVAGIYVVTTDFSRRRQGIGAVLTQAAVQAARENGLRVATLQATGDGTPVYRRLGFTVVGEYELFEVPAPEPAQ